MKLKAQKRQALCSTSQLQELDSDLRPSQRRSHLHTSQPVAAAPAIAQWYIHILPTWEATAGQLGCEQTCDYVQTKGQVDDMKFLQRSQLALTSGLQMLTHQKDTVTLDSAQPHNSMLFPS